MPVLFFVTGATGFVGRALCPALPATHRTLAFAADGWERRLVEAPLEGATIIHLAARVDDPRDRDEAAFQRDNVEKTRRLAQEAVRKRARRVVFLSTIKVHGEETHGKPVTVDDATDPQDAYARSKLAAERVLAELCGAGGIEWVIVRSPLVLGASAKGNLGSLLRLADTPWPLPFGAIDNRRSFVHIRDLGALLFACAESPVASGRTFLAAHPVPFSTAGLLSAMRRALGRPERLFAMPAAGLEAVASLVGQGQRVRPLTRSLEVDASPAREFLGWTARVGHEEAAAEMAADWMRRRR